MEQAASAIRTDWMQLKAKRVRETNEANLQVQLDGMVRPDVDPEVLARSFQDELVPMLVKTGQFTRTELSERFIDKLIQVSEANGGMPEIFDAADIPGPGGQSPARANPALALKVSRARIVAAAKADKIIKEDTLVRNNSTWLAFNKAIKNEDWDSISDDVLMQHVDKSDVFNSFKDMQEFMDKRDKARYGSEQTKAGIHSYQSGDAAFLDPKVAKAAYDQITAPFEKSVMENLGKPGPEAEAAVLSGFTNILRTAERGKVGHINEALKNRIEAFALAVPKEGAPPPTDFLQMAKVYESLRESNPTLMAKYFDNDARDLFESYVGDESRQMNAPAAYTMAYRSISAEEKKRVEQLFKNDPTLEQKVGKQAEFALRSFTDRFKAKWMGNFPTNVDAVHADAALQLRQLLMKNPGLDPGKAGDIIAKRFEESYVRDPESQLFIKVPVGMASQSTADAISDFTKLLKKEWSIDGASPDLMIAGDRNGNLRIQTVSPQRDITVPLSALVQDHSFRNNLQDTDLTNIGVLRQKVKDGSLTKADVDGMSGTIDKLKGMDKLTREERDAIGAANFVPSRRSPKDMYRARIAPLKITNDYAGTSAVDTFKTKPQLDNKNEVAQAFMARGDTAGALTAMGEGVALTAYGDPAEGAGLNIGLGYNKNGNANTWVSDFKAAGIPPEKNDDIWNGKASITREQAMRLYQVSAKRYAADAEKAYGEGWQALPANQKAVLLDLQWQVKGGIAKFPKAIAAFKRGDMETAAREIQVFYDGPNGKKADVGRTSLRSNMLAGPNSFLALINHVGRPNASKALASAE
jgi:hypothetical protein